MATGRNKRREGWFQFHLSTAMVFVFVAGFLLALNVRPRWDSPNLAVDLPDDQTPRVFNMYGWPFGIDVYYDSQKGIHYIKWLRHGYWARAALDAIICILLIVAICALFEWLVPRGTLRRIVQAMRR